LSLYKVDAILVLSFLKIKEKKRKRTNNGFQSFFFQGSGNGGSEAGSNICQCPRFHLFFQALINFNKF